MNHFRRISDAIKYIDENINEALTVEVIAERFAFSPYYFHRLFTAIVGQSMIAYVRSRRVAYACKMLNQTEKRVLEIALECGFDSAQSFSRTFKAVTGMSPVEYRNSNISPDIIPAIELVKRFTNRLNGGILMNPKMMKKNNMILVGVTGEEKETAELWKRFMKFDAECPSINKVSDDGYEVRIFDDMTGCVKVFVGCEINKDSEHRANYGVYECLELPSSEYASFDVYVQDGYESENNAISEWLDSNEKGYVENSFEGKSYCIEHYDARFDGAAEESIVEIWVPVKKENA